MTFSRRAATVGALALLVVAALAWVAPLVAGAEPGAISIVDTTFDPSTITINVGDTVTWTVTKAISQPHSVTSGTGSSDPDSGKLFDSGIKLQNNGDSFKFTFTAAGTYPFYCQVHPTTMTGTVTVLAAGSSGPPPAASGAPVPSAAPAASGGPAGSGGPAASGSAAPSIIPGIEEPPVPASDKVAAVAILGVAILLLFGSAWLYRRVNRPG